MRISLLAVDSSHARIYSDMLSVLSREDGLNYEISAIWDQDFSRASELSSYLGLDVACADIDWCIAQADAALVLGRFPDSHFLPAVKCIQNNIPVYVDKPFLSNVIDSIELIRLAKTNKTLILGGSSLRFSDPVQDVASKIENFNSIAVSAPSRCLDMGEDPRFMNLNFYGSHAIDILLYLLPEQILDCSIYYDGYIYGVELLTSSCRGLLKLHDSEQEIYTISSSSGVSHNTTKIRLDEHYVRPFLSETITRLRNASAFDASQSRLLNSVKILERLTQLTPNRPERVTL